MDLQDKKALITGGTSGMGSAAALAMAEKGASVIITGRDETRGASTVDEIRAGGHDRCRRPRPVAARDPYGRASRRA